MLINTEDMISVTDANKAGVSKLVAEAFDGRTFVVVRNNKPAAVITGLDQLDKLQNLEELGSDLRLMALAVIRSATDTGERHDLDDVAREFGIDLDELDDLDDNE